MCCSSGCGDGGGVGESWLVRDVVKRLRRKLGDSAENPRYVITEPRVGYRMAAGETTEEQARPDSEE